jgi:acetyl esterase/lipase
VRTVQYGDHADQFIDVWLLAGSQAQPAAVLIHGGYWRQRYDRSYLTPFVEHLVARGTAVASIEYRRVQGTGGWPETFDDIAAAVDLLPELLGGREIVLVGHSAGGHLALWAAASGHRVSRVVALAPLCDLQRAHELGLSDNAVSELLGGNLELLPEVDPMRLLPLGVPVTVLHGDADTAVPLELSERFAAAAGGEVTLTVLPGVGHFQLLDPSHPASALTVEAIDTP